MKYQHLYRIGSLMVLAVSLTMTACKKDDEPDPADDSYSVPSTYNFKDANGNSTVSFSGQTERLDQLSEMTTLMGTATSSVINAQDLKDMYANTGGNGNGNFSFSSTKQLKNKTFGNGVDPATQLMFEAFIDSVAMASASYASTASPGQAGTLSSGSSTYLFSSNGIEYKQLVEKGLMGAVFYYQAVSHYLADARIGDGVDNTTAVDPANGKYYTTMEHHWDEAFGYFGVPVTFPDSVPGRFWGKYCDSRNSAGLSSHSKPVNKAMMDAFLAGRAAISNDDKTTKINKIKVIRETWELISAAQAVYYFEDAKSKLGTDNAKFLHALSEAWAFTNTLKYSPVETRKMTPAEVDNILSIVGTDFWNVTAQNLTDVINELKTKYGL